MPTSSVSVGQQFNSLTVIAPDNRPHHPSSWLCRCECGKEAYFSTSSLIKGIARSCGCKSHRNINEAIDLTGKRFGYLQVLSRSNNPRHKSQWLCRCDCGSTIELYASFLIAGQRTSCGCVHQHAKHPYVDLAGRRFGHVTVISRSNGPKYKSKWHCICDCGNEFDTYTSYLLKGNHTSCGKCRFHRIKVKEAMIGKRYHHLTVESIIETELNKFMLLCRCDCGEYTLASTCQLKRGYKRSCGCNLGIRPRIRSKPIL